MGIFSGTSAFLAPGASGLITWFAAGSSFCSDGPPNGWRPCPAQFPGDPTNAEWFSTGWPYAQGIAGSITINAHFDPISGSIDGQLIIDGKELPAFAAADYDPVLLSACFGARIPPPDSGCVFQTLPWRNAAGWTFSVRVTNNTDQTITINSEVNNFFVGGSQPFVGPDEFVPDLNTIASYVDGELFDTATLANGSTPTGTLTFNLYKDDCLGSPIFTDVIAVADNGIYESAHYVPTENGTYIWTVEYSGDIWNLPAATDCADLNEQVDVVVTFQGLERVHQDTTLVVGKYDGF